MQASGQRAGGRSPTAHEELSVGQMVLANRPWRLVRDLSKVLVATLASAGFFIVNSNAWGIADQLAIPILVLIAVLAVVGLGVWLAVAHSLWERPSQRRDSALTHRVNAATVLTLVLGLLFAYVVLYVVVLASIGARGPRAIPGVESRPSGTVRGLRRRSLVRCVDGRRGRGDRFGPRKRRRSPRNDQPVPARPPGRVPVGRASLPLAPVMASRACRASECGFARKQ